MRQGRRGRPKRVVWLLILLSVFFVGCVLWSYHVLVKSNDEEVGKTRSRQLGPEVEEQLLRREIFRLVRQEKELQLELKQKETEAFQLQKNVKRLIRECMMFANKNSNEEFTSVANKIRQELLPILTDVDSELLWSLIVEVNTTPSSDHFEDLANDTQAHPFSVFVLVSNERNDTISDVFRCSHNYFLDHGHRDLIFVEINKTKTFDLQGFFPEDEVKHSPTVWFFPPDSLEQKLVNIRSRIYSFILPSQSENTASTTQSPFLSNNETLKQPRRPIQNPTYLSSVNEFPHGSCLNLIEWMVWQLSKTQLDHFHNIHQNQRCVIIGNGPSLRDMDLSFLNNEITLGLNKIHLGFSIFKFRVKYLVAVNRLVLEQMQQVITEGESLRDIPKFLSLRGLSNISYVPASRDARMFLKTSYLPASFFCTDLRFPNCSEGATVTFVALQVAYWMGCNPVVLIGVDHSFSQRGKPNSKQVMKNPDVNHFHPSYFAKGTEWNLADLKLSERAYKIAQEAYEKDRRSVIDATLHGKLMIFPKIHYKQLFFRTSPTRKES